MRVRKIIWTSDAEPIIVIMAILIVLGTINVFSSSYVLASMQDHVPYYFLIRHCGMLVFGIIAFLLCRRLDYKKWRAIILPFLVFIGACLVAVLIFATPINGAKRWLNLGITAFQPAEFAKLLSILIASASISHQLMRKGAVTLFNRQFLVILGMAFLVELEPDMGTAMIIVGVPFFMSCIAGVKKGQLKTVVGLAVAALTALIFLQPYRMRRMSVLWDPWADAQGIGYQTVQSLSTIGSGGFWGMGLGEGVSKYAYLPEAHTDFAFAIFSQEHGFIGALLVFGLFLALTLYCVRIANLARDAFGQILALGIMLLISGQAFINMAMVCGLAPVIGVPLPFISYGGSSLIVTMAAMGMLANIADGAVHSPRERHREEQAAEEKAERKKEPYLHLVRKEHQTE